MMSTIETYVRKGRISLRNLMVDPAVGLGVKIGGSFVAGMVLSGASLAQQCIPLSMGLVCALSGWWALVTALGGAAGYEIFWGQAGHQGLVWLAGGLLAALLLGKRRILEESPFMMMAVAALIVSASGLLFQAFLGDTTSVPMYLLRIGLGASSAKLFEWVRKRQSPEADWLAQGVGVLALAQIAPFGVSAGFLAAGVLAVIGTLPAAALAGLALDLSQVTPTPMTAVLCLTYLTRLLPAGEKWIRYAAPVATYLLVMGLCGQQDFYPVVGLAVGSGLAMLLPPGKEVSHRRGDRGVTQVRLELMAECLGQMGQLLLEAPEIPVDREAILQRARQRACGTCPTRKTCAQRDKPLPQQLLETPITDTSDLPLSCKKPARLILELHRAQEQYRLIRADRQRQGEYRGAVMQQYVFLSEYLRQQSDGLLARQERIRQRFHPEVTVVSAGREIANGDRCVWFAGPNCRYYILLCDGMGTGTGAAAEGQSAVSMLHQMLLSGFPAEYALRSINSLLVLRQRSGAVTVDLAELDLSSGRVVLYKWGAAPSILIRDGTAEKIGTATPPPGLSVTENRETVDRLSLRRGEVLILLSDGVAGEDALRRMGRISALPPGELAAKILEVGARDREDDATVAAVTLLPGTTVQS